MQTFEGNLDHFNPATPYAGDEKVPVKFYMGVLKDDAASEEAGRPIFKDVEFIKIFNSKDNIIDRPIRPTDLERWPGQYQRWKATGESEPGTAGTRLEYWPQMTRAQAEEFKYFKIFTVEQLAEAPDNLGDGLMNFQRLKALAKAYTEAAADAAPLAKLQAQLDEAKGRNAALEDQLRQLLEKVEKLEKKGK